MEIDLIKLGKQIKRYREKRGLSQYNLSGKTGISRSYISQIESGLFSLSLDYLITIANELEVGADVLLKDSLKTSGFSNDEELSRILMDCSPEEERILTKNMKSLRETIRPYKIK